MISQIVAELSRENLAGTSERATIEWLRAMVVGTSSSGERFHAMFFDEYQSCLGDACVGSGGAGSIGVRMRELFGRALALGASGILVAHNHPSGLCRPSQYDIHATRRLKEIGRALDIELLDHLIFTQDAVYSMRAGGNL
ncbi:MAG: JAB domain-containing protein [Erythrobacter sp.]